MGVAVTAPQDVFNVGEAAVRHGEIHLRPVLQAGEGGSGAEGFPVEPQLREIRISGAGVIDQAFQILRLPDTVGGEVRCIFPVATEIVDHAAVAQRQIHFRVFQRAHAVVGVAVGEDDVLPGGVLRRQQLRVQLVALKAGYQIVAFLRRRIEAGVIALALPLKGLLQCLPLARHHVRRQPESECGKGDEQKTENDQ